MKEKSARIIMRCMNLTESTAPVQTQREKPDSAGDHAEIIRTLATAVSLLSNSELVFESDFCKLSEAYEDAKKILAKQVCADISERIKGFAKLSNMQMLEHDDPYFFEIDVDFPDFNRNQKLDSAVTQLRNLEERVLSAIDEILPQYKLGRIVLDRKVHSPYLCVQFACFDY